MMYRLAQNGVICINLSDYNEFCDSNSLREKVDYFAVRLVLPKELSNYFITLIFRSGQRYCLSNLYLWVIPRRIDELCGNDINPKHIAPSSQDYLPQSEAKYDAMQIPIVQVIELHYTLSVAFVLVRQCDEGDFIAAHKNQKMIDPQSVYRQMRDDFKQFISGFHNVVLPEIMTSLLAQQWLLILSDSELRKGIIARKSSPQNKLKLTPRELQCLSLLSMECNVKKVAKDLNLSPETIKAHKKSICRKMNCATITEAISKALRIGLLF